MKNTPLILAIILAVLFPLAVSAQLNYVLNGSFEQHDTCPSDYDQIRYAFYWNGIDTTYYYGVTAAYQNFLPDYMNTCDVGGFCRVPNNPYFFHYPHTGDGMMENIMYYDMVYLITTGYSAYNYTQGRLKYPLVAGQTYCVTFYVVKERISEYSTDKIGAYLDDGKIDTTQSASLPQTQYTPQILETAIISDTLNWTKIQGSFTATGTEKFITIGVFYDTAHVNVLHDGSIGGSHVGIYLIDDVSVIASNAHAYAGRDTVIMHPGDTVTLGPKINGDGMPCWWYVLGGTAPIDSGGNTTVHPTATTSYVVKMDLCGTVTFDTVKVWVYPDTPLAVASPGLSPKERVTLYPNPASSGLTIQNASGCEVVVYDVLGREVASFAILTNNEVMDISALAKGVYLVKVTDTITGENITLRLLKE